MILRPYGSMKLVKEAQTHPTRANHASYRCLGQCNKKQQKENGGGSG